MIHLQLHEYQGRCEEQEKELSELKKTTRSYRDTIDEQRSSLESTAKRIIQLERQRDAYRKQICKDRIEELDQKLEKMDVTDEERNKAIIESQKHAALEKSGKEATAKSSRASLREIRNSKSKESTKRSELKQQSRHGDSRSKEARVSFKENATGTS